MTIQELLSDSGVEYAEEGNQHCRPGWLQIQTCPFCGSDRYHLGFNLQSRYFNCWKCRGHHVITTLLKLGVSRQLATEFFQGREAQPIERERTRAAKLVVPKHVGPLLSAHRRYLRDRGFDPTEIADTWGVGGIGLAARLAWRLYIPIFRHGKQVSWTTRAIGPDVEQRYVSASAEEETQNHKSCVYGLDLVRHSVVIVEGPTDAWAVGPGAGALFGTAFTAAQVQQLAAVPYRFVCFDSAPDAQRNALELARQLMAFPGSTHNVVLDSKDPGSAGKGELRALRKAAQLD